MDKRTLILGTGALAAAMVPLAMKAEAAETPDWRDEMLSHYDYFSFYQTYETEPYEIRPGEMGMRMRMKSSTLLNMFEENDKWVVGHFYNEYIPDVEFPNDRISTNLEGAYTKFDTRKEAYLYGKELKAKYYT